MSTLVPQHRLDVSYPAQAWGRRLYCGDSFSWNLVALVGTAGASYEGFALDASGDHLIQSPVPVWLAADETQWTPQAGDAYSYTHGTDAGLGAATGGTAFLVAQPPAGNVGAAFHTLFSAPFDDDEGVRLDLWRGQAPAGTASGFYVCLNDPGPAGPPTGLPDGFPWAAYRVAAVPGSPIRLQSSADSVTWADVAVASALGDSDGYLNTVGRGLSIEVLPKTDPQWYASLPRSAATGGPPPNQLDVTINGSDAVFTVPAKTFYGGRVSVSGAGGQWSCRVARRRFRPLCTASLPVQASRAGRAVQGTPVALVQGYVPDDMDAGGGGWTLTGPGTVTAALALDSSATVDGTGYAPRTVFLSSLTLDFPAIFGAPATYPSFVSYGEPDLAFSRTGKHYDQATMTLRRRAEVLLTNNASGPGSGGAYSPGNVLLAARAARLSVGGPGFAFNPDDPTGQGLWPQVTGWTMMAAGRGAEWGWQGGQSTFRVWIEGRLRRGDADQVPCGYMPPDDGDCHYAAMRRLLYRLGVGDDWMQSWPYVLRGQPTPYYYLPRGTTREPILQPHPSTPVCRQMEVIRGLSGEYDPGGSGQVLPMVIAEDELGNIGYFPMPVGVVQWFLDPTLTLADLGIAPQQVFSPVPRGNPDGSPALNEITGGGMRTAASLSHVRTPVVYEGIDPALGAAVVGVAYNELLGDGPYSDPDTPGSVGLDVPFIDISRYVTSADVAQFLADLASVQLAVPAISAVLPLNLQPTLDPLQVVAVAEPVTQGTGGAVPYWTGDVTSSINYLNPDAPEAETVAACRLLGQPGD